jgi:hypothetical protein
MRNMNDPKLIDTSLIESYLARWPCPKEDGKETIKTGTPNLDHPEVFNVITDFLVFLNDLIQAGSYDGNDPEGFTQRAWQAFWLRDKMRNAKRDI